MPNYKPLDDRQVINRAALPNIGAPANDTLDDVFSRLDSLIASLSSGGTYIAKKVSLTLASTSTVVTIPSQADTSYVILGIMGNTTDTNPQFQQIEVTAKSVSGFTFSWNVPTDSSNYFIYYVIPSKTSTIGESSIGASASSKAIIPSILQPNSNFGAITELQNIVDTNPQFQAAVIGAGAPDIITDWQSYTVVITGTISDPTPGTHTQSAFWRRIGDSVQISYRFSQTSGGSAGSGFYLFNLPPGLVIDTSKVDISTGAAGINATALGSSNTSNTTSDNTPTATQGTVVAYDTTHVYPITDTGGGNTATAPNSSIFPISTTQMFYSFNAIIPIVGWSSSNTNNLNVSWDVATDTANYKAAYLIGTGQMAIPNGATSLTVPLSADYGAINYAIIASMQNKIDSAPQFQPMVFTAGTNSTATIKWNVPTDSANYLLNYYAISLTP